MSLKLKKGDIVQVIAGKGRLAKTKGRIIKVVRVTDRKGNPKIKLLVEGVRIVSKHTRPNQKVQQGGIVKKESLIDISNVMLVCPRCNKPAKVGIKLLKDGEKSRICKKCKEVL